MAPHGASCSGGTDLQGHGSLRRAVAASLGRRDATRRTAAPLLITATLATTLAALPALGQKGGLRRAILAIGLQNTDFTAMEQAGASLYQASAPEVGQKATWDNTEASASGEAAVSKIEANCMSVDHAWQVPKRTNTGTFKSRRRQNADGEWTLALE
ncbi:MAG: hypothetical protein AAF968_21100 [Pseudomonadota bacterium]